MGFFGLFKKPETGPQLQVGPNGEMLLGGVQIGWENLPATTKEDQLKLASDLAASNDVGDILAAIDLVRGLTE